MFWIHFTARVISLWVHYYKHSNNIKPIYMLFIYPCSRTIHCSTSIKYAILLETAIHKNRYKYKACDIRNCMKAPWWVKQFQSPYGNSCDHADQNWFLVHARRNVSRMNIYSLVQDCLIKETEFNVIDGKQIEKTSVIYY